MIPSVRNLPYETRLKKLCLWSLEHRRVRTDIIEVYKITHGLSSVKFDTFLNCQHMNGPVVILWNSQRIDQELNWDNTSSAKESLTSGIDLVMTQSVHHRWTVLNIIWRSFIKISHLIGCCSLFGSRGLASLPPPGEASSGEFNLSSKLKHTVVMKPALTYTL